MMNWLSRQAPLRAPFRVPMRVLCVAWAVLLVLDLLALAGAARLKFDTDLYRTFASDSPRFAGYQRFKAIFTSTDNDLLMVFESADFAVPARLDALSSFTLDVQLVDGVEEMFSLFSLNAPLVLDGASDGTTDGTAAPIIPAPLPAQADLRKILDSLQTRQSRYGRLITPERTLTAVMVTLSPSGADQTARNTTLAELKALAETSVAGQGITVSSTGYPLVQEKLIDGMFGDFTKLIVIGLISGLLTCVFILRSWRLALLVLFASGTAMLWMIGAFSLLGFQINIISVTLPILVLVLSTSNCLHLSFEIGRLFKSGKPASHAIALTMRRIGPACALATLTTAIAFGALGLSSSTTVHEFGIAGMIGTLVALLAVITVQPLLFSTWAYLFGLDGLFSGDQGRPVRVLDWRFLSAFGMRNSKAVVIGSAIALVILTSLYANVQPVYSALENLSRNDPIYQTLQRVDRELTPMHSIDVPVDVPVEIAGAGGAALSADTLRRVVEVHEAASAMVDGSIVVSLATLIERSGRDDLKSEAGRLNRLIGQMSDNQRGRFVASDHSTAVVRIYVPEMDAAQTRSLVTALDARLAGLNDPAKPHVHPATGYVAMSAFESASMLRELNYCFLIAIAASGLLTLLWFRNVAYGLIALIPNVLPMAMVGAWLTVSGWGLQFSSATAMAIAFGIAIDDTVHILNRLKLSAPADDIFNLSAVRQSLRDVTPILTTTTMVLCAGMASSFFSSLPTVTYFGVLSIVVFIFAIAADLLVLPAWLTMAQQMNVRFKTRGTD